MAQLPNQPCSSLSSSECPWPPVSHSVRINVLSSLSAGILLWQHTNNPSPTNWRHMKAADFDPLFTNPHTAWYILSSTFLVAVQEKSDREASQLAHLVPLLSYHGAAGCAGLKGTNRWAVFCRTQALLSNRWGPLQDDFRWITPVIVLSASSFPLPWDLIPFPEFHAGASTFFVIWIVSRFLLLNYFSAILPCRCLFLICHFIVIINLLCTKTMAVLSNVRYRH